MSASSVIIQNLKCGGCANTVTNKLSELEGVSNVKVNVDSSEVIFELEKEENMQQVIERLAQIGYPIEGDENSLMQKAKSFVSCAVGRMS
ncbi:MAG: heavy-metal-associated domain-containing protein [Flavobacteriales bacterium]|nr:heavy-metal-associated domain-containing protein [Flavobacteriales bacterium]